MPLADYNIMESSGGQATCTRTHLLDIVITRT